MAADQPNCFITPNEIELLSFLRQNIIRKLCEEAAHQGRPKTDPWVIHAVVEYFNMGLPPPPTGSSTTLSINSHTRFEVSFCGSANYSHVTPQTTSSHLKRVRCEYGCDSAQAIRHSDGRPYDPVIPVTKSRTRNMHLQPDTGRSSILGRMTLSFFVAGRTNSG